jgi:hypothetical protein
VLALALGAVVSGVVSVISPSQMSNVRSPTRYPRILNPVMSSFGSGRLP